MQRYARSLVDVSSDANEVPPQHPLSGHPLEVAPLLLGALLHHGGVTVRITEVEAYGGAGEDPGSHAFRGRTPRTEVMFGPVGHLYVYFTYGMHWCANVVAHRDGEAGAILLRAGEVIEGQELSRRGRSLPVHRLASGPARLAVALGFTGAQNGMDLSELLTLPPVAPVAILSTPRTGVAGEGAARPWRLHLAGERTVSPYRPARMRIRPRV